MKKWLPIIVLLAVTIIVLGYLTGITATVGRTVGIDGRAGSALNLFGYGFVFFGGWWSIKELRRRRLYPPSPNYDRHD